MVIKELKQYLSYGVKEGYIDEDYARDLVKRKAWKEVLDLMGRGDAYEDYI